MEEEIQPGTRNNLKYSEAVGTNVYVFRSEESVLVCEICIIEEVCHDLDCYLCFLVLSGFYLIFFFCCL
jgi:hypothetical protein